MKKNNKLLIILVCLFTVLLGTTLFISFSSNIDVQAVAVKSITPVYDESSTVVVDEDNVIFNDKNQVVEYKVVMKNTQDYDVKVNDIKLPTPSKDFLKYELENVSTDDVLKAKETKEFIIHLETMGIEGWGRNFADELIANISFDKVVKQETEVPPTDEIPKEEDIPSEEIPKEETNEETVEEEPDNDKIENPYTSDNIFFIVLSALTFSTGMCIVFIISKNKVARYMALIIVLSSTLTIANAQGLIELSIKLNVSFESPNIMKVSNVLDDNGIAIFNDYWKYNKYIKNFYIENEFREITEYAYKFDVSEAQNESVIAYLVEKEDESLCYENNGNLHICYDLYLQADGVIRPNPNASSYFSMENLQLIDNLEGLDTSNVTNMSGMFCGAGRYVSEFILDLSSLDTGNVTNMSFMFALTGGSSETLVLNISNFDTSNVTNMNNMFYEVGLYTQSFDLDVSNFDTRNVTDMSCMFKFAAYYNNTSFTLDASGLDTSNVVDMFGMFWSTGYNSTQFNTSITIRNPNMTSYNYRADNRITIHYTKETNDVIDQIIEVGGGKKGNLIVDVDNLAIGDEIHISGEKFNVISQTEDTITMLAQYNLSTDYKQSVEQNSVTFSDTSGWEYTPGPKEIDIQEWSTNPKTYVNEYVEYLKTELEDDSVTGDLITLKELQTLGCTIQDNYLDNDDETCTNSLYKSWLINNQLWWTRSTSSEYDYGVWFVYSGGNLNKGFCDGIIGGIRPVITISKEALNNYLKTS